jgi:hypothetical protein
MLSRHKSKTDINYSARAITLVIALVTVSFKCIQAALANPVNSLRVE